jgi:hypothetical protein
MTAVTVAGAAITAFRKAIETEHVNGFRENFCSRDRWNLLVRCGWML